MDHLRRGDGLPKIKGSSLSIIYCKAEITNCLQCINTTTHFRSLQILVRMHFASTCFPNTQFYIYVVPLIMQAEAGLGQYLIHLTICAAD